MAMWRCQAWLVLCVFCCLVETSQWNYDLDDYTSHVCNRPCQDYTTPRLCHYDFAIENYYVLSKACFDCPFNQTHCSLPQCVSAGGARRLIKTVNRVLPGPPIEVCQGDTIEVKVTNLLEGSEGTTIHWHGIKQRTTPHMDGVPMVTQCPILHGSHFTYRFTATDAGTYFWHSHAGTHRSDGLFGPLVIRQAPSQEPHRALYDLDLSEHVIVVNDWFPISTSERLAAQLHYRENLQMTILINGKGQYQKVTNETLQVSYFTPRATFTVSPGRRYRFRLINSGITNCPLEISVDNHTLTLIASDGSPVQPLPRDKFTTYTGERYDFVLEAKTTLPLRNYWIKVRGQGDCLTYNITQAAILKYRGAETDLPTDPLTWDTIQDEDQVENTVLRELESLTPADDVVLATPDRKLFLNIDLLNVENLMSYNPPYYSLRSSLLFQSPQINSISSLMPPAPPLTQLKDLPQDIFCNAETVQHNCSAVWCACVHLYQLNLGELVELIILDNDAIHPMHLHGHTFRVIGTGKVTGETTLEDLKRWDSQGQLNRTLGRAPFKDTATSQSSGYYIARFRADNPGFWIFHCHLEFHADTGMLLVFQVGNTTQLPPKPKNFPSCGSFDFTGYEDSK